MNIRDQALANLQPPPGAPASAWALRIGACWRASFEAILEVGRLLSEAKAALPHGAFGEMCEADLPFTARTAQMLMAIAADQRITNPKHVSDLPASWGTLYELTKLSDEQFERGIVEKTIKPDMERKEVPHGARSIMSSRQEPDDSLDYFPTPPWATRALIEVVLPDLGITRLESADDPACGEGHIAEVLREYVKPEHVFASDIFDYGYSDRFGPQFDYLNPMNHFIGPDWEITNPPFGDKTEQFVLRAIKEAFVGVAMFVRLQWLESGGRYENIFRDYPPTCIAFFAERVNLCKGRWEPEGSTATAYIWLVWIKGMAPQAPFWIPPGQRKALTRPDDAERFTAHPVIKAKRDASGAVVDHDGDGVVVDDDSIRVVSSSIPIQLAPTALSTAIAHGETSGGDHDAPLTDKDGGALPEFLRRGAA